MKKIRLFLAFIFLIAFNAYARADYQVTGPTRGTECTLGIVCSTHTIAAVRDDKGTLRYMPTYYSSVSDFNGTNCFINTKSTGLGFISMAINAIKQPVFLELDSKGNYKELDIESISFPCRKR
jgi:hypothetical protein